MTDQYMPNIHEFAMYSRIDDIARKTDEELRFLHQMGLTTLHIGLESGSDSILLEQKKGRHLYGYADPASTDWKT